MPARDFDYRAYTIYHCGFEYVAALIDQTEDDFELGASSVDEAISMIDELYEALGAGGHRKHLPDWYAAWLDQPGDVMLRARRQKIAATPPQELALEASIQKNVEPAEVKAENISGALKIVFAPPHFPDPAREGLSFGSSGGERRVQVGNELFVFFEFPSYA